MGCQYRCVCLFEENDIKITNNVNAECYVIPYNQVVCVRRKKNLLLFFTKDYHLIAVDQSGIPFGGQNELFHSVFEKCHRQPDGV